MRRSFAVCLALALPLAAPGTAQADQKAWSSSAAPTSKQEWERATQLRVKANFARMFKLSKPAGASGQAGQALLELRVLPDGSIAGASIASGSGSKALDDQLLTGASRLPQMPAFTPDMRVRQMRLLIPVLIPS